MPPKFKYQPPNNNYCVECNSEDVIFYCINCKEFFCKKCFDEHLIEMHPEEEKSCFFI